MKSFWIFIVVREWIFIGVIFLFVLLKMSILRWWVIKWVGYLGWVLSWCKLNFVVWWIVFFLLMLLGWFFRLWMIIRIFGVRSILLIRVCVRIWWKESFCFWLFIVLGVICLIFSCWIFWGKRLWMRRWRGMWFCICRVWGVLIIWRRWCICWLRGWGEW